MQRNPDSFDIYIDTKNNSPTTDPWAIPNCIACNDCVHIMLCMCMYNAIDKGT